MSTRLTFSQPEESETFLAVDPSARSAKAALIPETLMLTAGAPATPPPPNRALPSVKKRPPARRVHVAPNLKDRLEGGIVLPPELNRQGGAAWEIQADISVSREGVVRHVFLEQPLEVAELNQSIVRLLHGLRFKSGVDSVEGRIEIYSAAPSGEGATP
jgi:hypothetical protein